MKNHVLQILKLIRSFYWNIFKPKTYGVKVIIQHPHSNKILIVQHAYGNQTVWHLPGGGYRPKQEAAEAAAVREIFEELGIELAKLTFVAEYKTSAEGKQDTIIIFSARSKLASLSTNHEIKTTAWIHPSNLLEKQTYKITRFAISIFMHKQKNSEIDCNKRAIQLKDV